MRKTLKVVVLALLATGVALAADDVNRNPKKAYQQAVKAEKAGDYRRAYEAYSEAARLDPKNTQYITSREIARQRIAFRLVSEGMRLMREDQTAKAVEVLNDAIEIDPTNDFARHQRDLADSKLRPRENPVVDMPAPAPEAQGAPLVALQPKSLRRDWELRGDTKTLYLAVGAAYGVQFAFDEELKAVTAHLSLTGTDFSETVNALGDITKTFAAPLTASSALVAEDSNVKRLAFERQIVQELDAGQFVSPESLAEVSNVLRNLLELQWVQVNNAHRLITVRGPAGKVLMAERIVNSLALGRAEVVIDIQVVEATSTSSRQFGVLPDRSFSLSKISKANGVETGNTVPIPQLFGRPPTAGTQPPPLATFGGGLSLFGINVPGATLMATFSNSIVRGLSTAELRAGDGVASVFLFGSKYPIVIASFSPVFLAGSALQQQQNGTLVNPFPAFQFEDLGLKIKATPRIHNGEEVTLALEVTTRSLSGTSFNGLPSISNRELQTQVRVRNGETVVLTGILDQQETRSLSTVPGLGNVPGLNLLFGQSGKQLSDSEVIVLLTPRIVRLGPNETAVTQTIPYQTGYVPVLRPPPTAQ